MLAFLLGFLDSFCDEDVLASSGLVLFIHSALLVSWSSGPLWMGFLDSANVLWLLVTWRALDLRGVPRGMMFLHSLADEGVGLVKSVYRKDSL